MSREIKTYPQDWIDGDQAGGSPLTPEEKSLAGHLTILGKADFPEAGFVGRTASDLAGIAREPEDKHTWNPHSLWNGMRSAWQLGAGLIGVALLIGVLVFSMRLLPHSAGSPGPAQPGLTTPLFTPLPDLLCPDLNFQTPSKSRNFVKQTALF